MGMVIELERAIWAAAEPIRATRFAQVLRNARASTRDASVPGPDDETQTWELSFNPAIQRTIAAVNAIGIMHHSPPNADSEWLKWNLEAKKAVARLAAKCWAGVDAQRRILLIDEDNFQPIWNQVNLYDLRSDSPGRHMDFEGLNNPEVRDALRDIYEAARATPAYENVLRADHQLGHSRDNLILWTQLAQKGLQELGAASTELAIGDCRQRGLEIVESLYAGTPVEDIAAAYRRFNRLVQHIAWSLLGLAEAIPGPFVLSDTVGTLRCTHSDDGSPFIRVTSAAAIPAMLRLTHPVWLDTGTPLDGLHLLIGYTMTVAPVAGDDLRLTPIRWSAGCWSGHTSQANALPQTS
jgi:hypothetical protein